MKLFYASMLVCCALLTFVTCAHIDENKRLEQMKEQCIEESGATDSEILDFLLQDDNNATVTTRSIKCLIACLAKKTELLTVNGAPDKAATLKTLQSKLDVETVNATLVNEIVEKCLHLQLADDHCEAALIYIGCLDKELQQRGMKWDKHL